MYLILAESFLGYDGTTNDWDDYSRYINPDGVDMSHVKLLFFFINFSCKVDLMDGSLKLLLS